jgi:hypothetical protein
MNFAARSISVAGLIAVCAISSSPAQTVDADGPVVDHSDVKAASARDEQTETFRSAMDRTFSPGRWRETSGYRSPAREDELRRQGAGTVPAGHLSHHSEGSPDAPGAYDAVVTGMSVQRAALELRRAGQPFARVIAERAHGGQGPHLHIEPRFAGDARSVSKTDPDDTIYLRIVGGRRNPILARQ